MSYDEILRDDKTEYESCEFDWKCDRCSKSLCLRTVAMADFPSEYGFFKVMAFENNKDGKDHVAIVKGDVAGGKDVLARVHPSCVTGDVLGSFRCDCGDQLKKALHVIEKEGQGILLYMQQDEGGMGSTNKIKAYMYQDKGMDTHEPDLLLGSALDLKTYELAAAMLKKFRISSVRLLTNNPQKIRDLEQFGVRVTERVPLEIPPNSFNRFYLETKKDKFGHLLSLRADEEK